jgi:hypothetical protein
LDSIDTRRGSLETKDSLIFGVNMAESFVLNTNAAIPSVGLGTWQISPGAVQDAIRAAVQVFSFLLDD